MCINCNLICPVIDYYADAVGVERRKYVAASSSLNHIHWDPDVVSKENFYFASNQLLNYKTSQCFRFGKWDEVPSIVVTHEGHDVRLYEYFYEIIKPLPHELLNRINVSYDNMYFELFRWKDEPVDENTSMFYASEEAEQNNDDTHLISLADFHSKK